MRGTRAGAFPLLLLSLIGLLALPAQAQVPAPPRVDASAYYLMDVQSGEVVAQKAASRPFQPGSLAKLMTAFLAFQSLETGRIHADDPVRISEAVWRMDGTQMFLEAGEQVPVRRLLAGLAVANGNDAARALAGYIAGGTDTFTRMMNQQARALGMSETHFTNPSGLPTPQMQTTARDMAMLARALVRRFPEHVDLFARQRITHNGITQHNRNRLLGWIKGVNGLLTGHTGQDGYHLAVTAGRKGRKMQLVGITLGASTSKGRFNGMQAMLAHGFRFYQTVPLFAGGQPVETARVWQGVREQVPMVLDQPLTLTIPRRARQALEVIPHLRTPIRAPVQAGEALGQLRVTLDSRNLARRPLVAERTVKAAGWIPWLMDAAQLRWRNFWREQRRSLLADGKPEKREKGGSSRS